MAFVPAPNIVMAEWRCLRNLQQVENRMMINMLQAPTAALMTPLATTLWNWWQNDHAGKLSNSVQLASVVLTSMHVQNGPQVTYAPSTTVVGTDSTTQLPNEVSICVSLRSGFRGRSARGRWYMLSVTQGNMSSANSITPTHATACATSVQNLLNTITGAGYAPSIVSYRTNNAPRPGGPVYFVITGTMVVDNLVDSQRRRKPGVGA